MARIPEDTVERIAAASDIVDIIGTHMQLKRSGSSWKGLCPFHHEKTPSFHVNPGRQTYKCFGCGAGGGVFRFVMDYEHVDFQTAVRRLGARANIPVEEESQEDGQRRGERDRLVALHRDAAAWFHENLMRQKFAAHAREYLKKRGITSEVAVRWQLGYAPDSWDAATDMLRARGYTPTEISRSGLVTAKEFDNPKSKIQNPKSYDRFRNRLMFPISSDYGDVIAFSGRTLGDDPAKYVNSPETPIFTKGRVLFGLDKSKRAIIDANEAVVCEGQLDLIAAFETGVQNVTAPQGTAFTPDQARMLKRLAESVVLCFDSDDAGRKAVERSLPALLACGMNVRVARVPAGEDPDSLVRKRGADALREVIGQSRDYFDNILEEELTPRTPPQQRAALARELAKFVKVIADPALREAVAQRVRVRLELTEAAFAALVKNAPRPDADRDANEPPPVEEMELTEAAKLLCRLAIVSPEAREWMRARPEKAGEAFGAGYRVLDTLLDSGVALENPSALAAFCATLPPGQDSALAGLRLGKPPENPAGVAGEAWRGLLAAGIREQITAIQARMRLPETGLAGTADLHKQILDLQKRLGEV